MDKKSSSIMHSFTNGKGNSVGAGAAILVFIVVALLGAGTGVFLGKSRTHSAMGGIIPSTNGTSSSVTVGKMYGSSDTNTYKDTTEGILKEGGIDGEGQYHLVRPGGDSQNVYLTSSTVDLSTFLNHKIKVWGQTQAAQKAGWLMDVGRVQVLQ